MLPMLYAFKKKMCLIGKTNKGNYDWEMDDSTDLSTLRQHRQQKPHASYALCLQEEDVPDWKDQ